jgi:hypothetical protein
VKICACPGRDRNMEEKKIAITKKQSERITTDTKILPTNITPNKLNEIKVKSFSKAEISNEQDDDVYSVKVS